MRSCAGPACRSTRRSRRFSPWRKAAPPRCFREQRALDLRLKSVRYPVASLTTGLVGAARIVSSAVATSRCGSARMCATFSCWSPSTRPMRSQGRIRLPGAGLIFSSVNGRKWTEPPGKLLHDEVVPAQICRHRGVGLCGCEGVGNEGHEGRLAGRRTCAEHVAVESAHGRLAVPLSPRQLVSASSAATVGPGGSLAGRWVWRLPRRIPVPHGGARPRGSRRWRRRQ